MARRPKTERKGLGPQRRPGSATDAKSSPDGRQKGLESSEAPDASKRNQTERENKANKPAPDAVSLPSFNGAPGLYLVATPIGNLGDITLRALSVLAGADLIACEDTRMTRRLLDRYQITTRLTAYHDHSAKTVRPRLLANIEQGMSVALVSDAGMPLVSDPGYKLVRDAVARDLSVTVVPGPSSVPSALAISGLPSDQFLFAGFLPSRKAARTRELTTHKSVNATLIFFEAARRLPQSLSDMAAVFGPRSAAVARELTKKFEEVRRGDLAELAAHYAEAGPPKGEVVVVVAPPGDTPTNAGALDEILQPLLAQHSLKQAVAAATAETGLPRREVYARALELSGPK